ncbi:MAG: effector binding domain-containing protein [Mucilaginibacter sp.]
MTENLAFEQVNISQFFIAGIAVKTTNKDGQARKDIGDLWTKFMTENISQQITGKIADDVYCVYTDYESDYTGHYTAVLGCAVKDPGDAMGNFYTALIPGGDYWVCSPKGKFPESVGDAWMEIWETDISRKYTSDYECYKADAKSFEDTKVEIYLSVK